jgi:hypothetical protein
MIDHKNYHREIDEIAVFAKENDEDCLEILLEISMPVILKKSMKYQIDAGPVCDFEDLISTCIYITLVGIQKYDKSRGGFLTFLKRYLDWKLKAHVFGKESLPELPKDYPFFYREKYEDIILDPHENEYLLEENSYAVHELEDALIEYSSKNNEKFERARKALDEIYQN